MEDTAITYRVRRDGRVIMSHKWCASCKQLHRADQFPLNQQSYAGQRHSTCRYCKTHMTLRWQAMNPGWQLRLPRPPWEHPQELVPLRLTTAESETLYELLRRRIGNRSANSEDVAHEAYLAIISGEAPYEQPRLVLDFYRKWVWRMYSPYGWRSLDEPARANEPMGPGHRTLLLRDVIPAPEVAI